MSTAYIHYGSSKFDPEAFKKIKNVPFSVKPVGGLWASPKDIPEAYTWKKWCEDNAFRECDDADSFSFTLIPDANVFLISHASDLKKLPKTDENYIFGGESVYIDFEQCLRDGIDAIHLCCVGGLGHDLYFSLYGWDCDSLLVLNPDCIDKIF